MEIKRDAKVSIALLARIKKERSKKKEKEDQNERVGEKTQRETQFPIRGYKELTMFILKTIPMKYFTPGIIFSWPLRPIY